MITKIISLFLTGWFVASSPLQAGIFSSAQKQKTTSVRSIGPVWKDGASYWLLVSQKSTWVVKQEWRDRTQQKLEVAASNKTRASHTLRTIPSQLTPELHHKMVHFFYETAGSFGDETFPPKSNDEFVLPLNPYGEFNLIKPSHDSPTYSLPTLKPVTSQGQTIPSSIPNKIFWSTLHNLSKKQKDDLKITDQEYRDMHNIPDAIFFPNNPAGQRVLSRAAVQSVLRIVWASESSPSIIDMNALPKELGGAAHYQLYQQFIDWLIENPNDIKSISEILSRLSSPFKAHLGNLKIPLQFLLSEVQEFVNQIDRSGSEDEPAKNILESLQDSIGNVGLEFLSIYGPIMFACQSRGIDQQMAAFKSLLPFASHIIIFFESNTKLKLQLESFFNNYQMFFAAASPEFHYVRNAENFAAVDEKSARQFVETYTKKGLLEGQKWGIVQHVFGLTFYSYMQLLRNVALRKEYRRARLAIGIKTLVRMQHRIKERRKNLALFKKVMRRITIANQFTPLLAQVKKRARYKKLRRTFLAVFAVTRWQRMVQDKKSPELAEWPDETKNSAVGPALPFLDLSSPDKQEQKQKQRMSRAARKREGKINKKNSSLPRAVPDEKNSAFDPLKKLSLEELLAYEVEEPPVAALPRQPRRKKNSSGNQPPRKVFSEKQPRVEEKKAGASTASPQKKEAPPAIMKPLFLTLQSTREAISRSLNKSFASRGIFLENGDVYTPPVYKIIDTSLILGYWSLVLAKKISAQEPITKELKRELAADIAYYVRLPLQPQVLALPEYLKAPFIDCLNVLHEFVQSEKFSGRVVYTEEGILGSITKEALAFLKTFDSFFEQQLKTRAVRLYDGYQWHLEIIGGLQEQQRNLGQILPNSYWQNAFDRYSYLVNLHATDELYVYVIAYSFLSKFHEATKKSNHVEFIKTEIEFISAIGKYLSQQFALLVPNEELYVVVYLQLFNRLEPIAQQSYLKNLIEGISGLDKILTDELKPTLAVVQTLTMDSDPDFASNSLGGLINFMLDYLSRKVTYPTNPQQLQTSEKKAAKKIMGWPDWEFKIYAKLKRIQHFLQTEKTPRTSSYKLLEDLMLEFCLTLSELLFRGSFKQSSSPQNLKDPNLELFVGNIQKMLITMVALERSLNTTMVEGMPKTEFLKQLIDIYTSLLKYPSSIKGKVLLSFTQEKGKINPDLKKPLEKFYRQGRDICRALSYFMSELLLGQYRQDRSKMVDSEQRKQALSILLTYKKGVSNPTSAQKETKTKETKTELFEHTKKQAQIFTKISLDLFKQHELNEYGSLAESLQYERYKSVYAEHLYIACSIGIEEPDSVVKLRNLLFFWIYLDVTTQSSSPTSNVTFSEAVGLVNQDLRIVTVSHESELTDQDRRVLQVIQKIFWEQNTYEQSQ